MFFPLSRIIFVGNPSYIPNASKIYKPLDDNGPSRILKHIMLWNSVNWIIFHPKTDL